jgi:hypothetical protein
VAQQPRRSLQLFQAIEKDASGFGGGAAGFAMFHVEQWGWQLAVVSDEL